jgi:hypothetical protein
VRQQLHHPPHKTRLGSKATSALPSTIREFISFNSRFLFYVLLDIFFTSQSHGAERPRDYTVSISYQYTRRFPNGEVQSRYERSYIYFSAKGTAYADFGGSLGVVLPEGQASATTHTRIPRKDHIQTNTSILTISGSLSNLLVELSNDSVSSGGILSAPVTSHDRISALMDVSGGVCIVRSGSVQTWWEDAPDGRVDSAVPGSVRCQLQPGRHLTAPGSQ